MKIIVSVEEDSFLPDYEEAEKELDIDLKKLFIETDRDDRINFSDAIEEQSPIFERTTGEDKTYEEEIFLIFFTSGINGLPKIVSHKHTYSLEHIPKSKYWNNVVETGIPHTEADTGWVKAIWGNLYGQWINGTSIFIYDYERFKGIKLLEQVIEYKDTF